MARRWFTPAEKELMTRFVLERAQSSLAPINMAAMWRDLVMIENIDRSPEALHLRYVTALAREIQKSSKLSLDEKVRMMFSTRQPIVPELLGELRKHADVLELSERNTIIKYQKGDFLLKTEHKRLRKRVKREEADELDEQELFLIDSESTFPMPIPFFPIKLEAKEEEDEDAELKVIQNSEVTLSISTENTITVRKILKFLRNLINFLDSPQLSPLQQRIENALDGLEKKELPIHTVRLCIETILSMSLPNAFNLGDVEMVDSRFLLKFMRSTLLGWKSPAIQDILEKIEAAIGQVQEKKAPMKNVRVALEMVFTVVTRYC